MLKTKDSYNFLQSMVTPDPNFKDVTEFVLRIVYNRPLKDKTLGDARYNMLKTGKKDSKGRKIYPSSKSLPPDESSLKMKVLRSTFVTHCMSNCLLSDYLPLDPSLYGWKLEEGVWEPVWYEGNPLSDASVVEEDAPEENPGEREQNEMVISKETQKEETENSGDTHEDETINTEEIQEAEAHREEFIDSNDSEYAESSSDDDNQSDDDWTPWHYCGWLV